MSVKEHVDAFYAYIRRAGISRYRHDIVLAIAEKVATMLPKLGDADIFTKSDRK